MILLFFLLEAAAVLPELFQDFGQAPLLAGEDVRPAQKLHEPSPALPVGRQELSLLIPIHDLPQEGDAHLYRGDGPHIRNVDLHALTGLSLELGGAG